MIEGVDVGVPALDDSCGGSFGMLVVISFFYQPSQRSQFSKVKFPIGFGFWIFRFTKSPSQLPKIHLIANLLSSKLLQWKLENPKISQMPKILPIHPKFSQFPIPNIQASADEEQALMGGASRY
jgi:hypothetical protein